MRSKGLVNKDRRLKAKQDTPEEKYKMNPRMTKQEKNNMTNKDEPGTQ